MDNNELIEILNGGYLGIAADWLEENGRHMESAGMRYMDSQGLRPCRVVNDRFKLPPRWCWVCSEYPWPESERTAEMPPEIFRSLSNYKEDLVWCPYKTAGEALLDAARVFGERSWNKDL